MCTAYSALDIAKYMVEKCAREDSPISNLQLQKILFYIQKDYLKRESKLFDDYFEAWKFGPVIPNVYYSFCEFGGMPIVPLEIYNVSIDVETKETIDPIIEEKRKLFPWDLVNDTHKKGGAWDKTFNNGNGNRFVIPNELIKAAG